MKHIKILIAIIVLSISTNAQIDHNVQVVKAYKPSISDAYKMNALPKIADTVRLESVFKYHISPKPISIDFQLEPIRPARLQGEPLTKLYHTYIKLGFGNYLTPMAEIHYNSLRSKKYSLGAYYKHLSSFGKLKIRGQKVYAGYSNNTLGIYAKKFIKKRQTLYSDIDLSRNVFYYYGYTPYTYEVVSKQKQDLDKQHFLSATINTGIKNNYMDSLHLSYKTDLNLKHLEDYYKNQENEIQIQTELGKYFNEELQAMFLDLTLYNNDYTDTTLNSAILNVKPQASVVGEEWRIEIGLNFTADIYKDDVSYHNYPDVLFQYNVIDNYLIPYIGFSGYLQKNSMRNIVAENQFIVPGTYVNNTNHKMIFKGGMKGNFTPEITYDFNAAYSVIENMYFFVNDFDASSNKFNVIYDDMEMMHLHGDIDYKRTEKLNFILSGDFYQYLMAQEMKAWNKPDFTASMLTKYNLRNKILLNINLFAVGNRYTKFIDDNDQPEAVLLDAYFDANLGIEYRYSKILSGFINFNNVANMEYSRWYGYPVQRFNIMFGLTYSL